MAENFSARDVELLRVALAVAQQARAHGNHPFGAILTDADGVILLQAENTVVTEHDCTCHAETNLMRKASQNYAREFLATCSLYSSAEPCAMCAGAIYWGNVCRVVFALSEQELYAMTGDDPENPTFLLPCREVFAHGQKRIEVLGPALPEEAHRVHQDFWRKP